MKQILNHLFEHKRLTRTQAGEVLTNIAQGKYSDSEIAAFLTVYIMRSISVDELAGFRDALLDLCVKVDLSEFNTIDLCGTGGDGKDTFNISTITSFVVAGAGYKVAKHGNVGVSSSCGSSNVMEYFGYTFSNDVSKLKSELEKANICYMHAPLFHPAMKTVGPTRKNLKVKTFFNMLGPMVNPSFPKNQMVGVFSLELARMYQYLYQQSDKNYCILHGIDGYDEVSLTGPVKLISNSGERLMTPEDLGFKTMNSTDISGGSSVEEAANIFMDILQNKATESQTSVILANAALAIQCFDQTKSYEECLYEAMDSIVSGNAYKKFKLLIP